MSITPICSALQASTCYYNSTKAIATGYQCIQDSCYQCTTGFFSNDGKSCQSCPYGTASATRAAFCSSSLKLRTPGLQKMYIPMGVTKINVRLWGGGGGGSKSGDPEFYYPSSGGGGGYSSCNITVQMQSNIYVIVAGGGKAEANSMIQATGGNQRSKQCYVSCTSPI